jgi:putative endonuclease
MGDPRHRLGWEAEHVAADRLAALGWRVEARRFRSAEGELDLVCRDPAGALVGVEVRARSSTRTGTALDTVSRRHILRMRERSRDMRSPRRPRRAVSGSTW